MKIPTKLKILAHTYTVQEVEGLIDNGTQNSNPHTILIDKNLCQTEKEVVLLHEILHAINEKMSEKDIEFLAQTIYQVLKDNHLLSGD